MNELTLQEMDMKPVENGFIYLSKKEFKKYLKLIEPFNVESHPEFKMWVQEALRGIRPVFYKGKIVKIKCQEKYTIPDKI